MGVDKSLNNTDVLKLSLIGFCLVGIFTIVFLPGIIFEDFKDLRYWEISDAIETAKQDRYLCETYGGHYVGMINGVCDNNYYSNMGHAKQPKNLIVNWASNDPYGAIHNGFGISGSALENCGADYVYIEMTYGNGALPTCIEKSYYENASCSENFRLVWSETNYHCFKLSNDEIILKQQEELLDLLRNETK